MFVNTRRSRQLEWRGVKCVCVLRSSCLRTGRRSEARVSASERRLPVRATLPHLLRAALQQVSELRVRRERRSCSESPASIALLRLGSSGSSHRQRFSLSIRAQLRLLLMISRHHYLANLDEFAAATPSCLSTVRSFLLQDRREAVFSFIKVRATRVEKARRARAAAAEPFLPRRLATFIDAASKTLQHE